ncbi:MAG: DinB family protein [Bacteroidota bacterium]
MQLDLNEVPDFYRPYFNHIADESIIASLERSKYAYDSIIQELTEEKSFHRYAEGKWSIKDVLQHIIDVERVFMYRALRFSRNDGTDLSGFEENEYASDANADARSLEALTKEFDALRSSSIAFFHSLEEKKLDRKGTANGHPMSVRFLGYLISVHLLHHLQVINERYL